MLAVAGIACCGLSSALMTAGAVAYARRRSMFDLPGRRRSHAVPTPRGGGIGIVATVLAAILLCWTPRVEGFALAGAIALVGAAGWIDDRRGLAARWRLLAHVVAVAVLLVPFAFIVVGRFCALPSTVSCAQIGAFVALLVAVGGLSMVWSINLHNFMDGIDGILAVQSSFVFAVAAIALAHLGSTREAVAAAVCLAATLGFLPFNFPRAKVFMGDVGSGVLGLLVALFVIVLSLRPGLAHATGLIACSAFVIDATCTLLSRMLRGRRWYSAHREHLYQWLVRAGFSHARVVALYMGWNVLIVLPTLLWINRSLAVSGGWLEAVGLHALGVATWWSGKRWCLRRIANGGPHAPA